MNILAHLHRKKCDFCSLAKHVCHKSATCDEFCSSLLIWRLWRTEKSAQRPLNPTTCPGYLLLVLRCFEKTCFFCDYGWNHQSSFTCLLLCGPREHDFLEKHTLEKISSKDEVTWNKSIVVVVKTRFDLCFMLAAVPLMCPLWCWAPRWECLRKMLLGFLQQKWVLIRIPKLSHVGICGTHILTFILQTFTGCKINGSELCCPDFKFQGESVVFFSAQGWFNSRFPREFKCNIRGVAHSVPGCAQATPAWFLAFPARLLGRSVGLSSFSRGTESCGDFWV